MPRSQSDLSNTAIRIFLQDVGAFYDTERGLEPFRPSVRQKQEVHAFFDKHCAYCGIQLEGDLSTLDHLIPLNRTALGLHAWPNSRRNDHGEQQSEGGIEYNRSTT
jgi:hypothetical protein